MATNTLPACRLTVQGLFSTTVLGGSSSTPNLQDYARSHGKKLPPASLKHRDELLFVPTVKRFSVSFAKHPTNELLESTNTKLWPLKLTLEVAAWFILLIFILEILLKWLSNFSLFWKSAWNVFDFVVTMLVRIEILRVPLVG
ncbi:PREDICTED: uncharacterized protein LOC105502860 [Colobus angolensis palliatus]|uniref:uncharacterized protein LOC105502860 n=1 Tax=Colobus angolensis palliatus TaxID=336983 RepID=UPI0005F53FCE|nr:PREDICTED: uncharacterized protein LOC105502860 [Colobus angolensis palliatus]